MDHTRPIFTSTKCTAMNTTLTSAHVLTTYLRRDCLSLPELACSQSRRCAKKAERSLRCYIILGIRTMHSEYIPCRSGSTVPSIECLCLSCWSGLCYVLPNGGNSSPKETQDNPQTQSVSISPQHRDARPSSLWSYQGILFSACYGHTAVRNMHIGR